MKVILTFILLLTASTHVARELQYLGYEDLPRIVQYERGFRRSMKQILEVYNEEKH